MGGMELLLQRISRSCSSASLRSSRLGSLLCERVVSPLVSASSSSSSSSLSSLSCSSSLRCQWMVTNSSAAITVVTESSSESSSETSWLSSDTGILANKNIQLRQGSVTHWTSASGYTRGRSESHSTNWFGGGGRSYLACTTDSRRLVWQRHMPCLATPGHLLDQVQPSGTRMKARIATIAPEPQVIARDCTGVEEQDSYAHTKVPGAEQAAEEGMRSSSLTHVDSSGQALLVDVSHKSATMRVARASATVHLGPEAFSLVRANQVAKGDVLAVARIAGIGGAKLTSTLIPLCHNLFITGVDVRLALDEQSCSVRIGTCAKTTSQTGVEMEALTAASVAALTVYDMCKAVSKEIQITDIQLEEKSGGKSGHWRRGSPMLQK